MSEIPLVVIRPRKPRQPKTCPHCKAEFISRKADAIYCSRECWLMAIGSHEFIDHPPCAREGCNNPVKKRAEQRIKRWLAQMYCSNACASKSHGRGRPSKKAPTLDPDLLPAGCFTAHNLVITAGPFVRHDRPPAYVGRW